MAPRLPRYRHTISWQSRPPRRPRISAAFLISLRNADDKKRLARGSVAAAIAVTPRRLARVVKIRTLGKARVDLTESADAADRGAALLQVRVTAILVRSAAALHGAIRVILGASLVCRHCQTDHEPGQHRGTSDHFAHGALLPNRPAAGAGGLCGNHQITRRFQPPASRCSSAEPSSLLWLRRRWSG